MMTMLEAETFFKAFDGRKFHMDRDEPYKYQLYQRLNVPKETEDRWRAEAAAGKRKPSALPAEEYDGIVERLLEQPYHVIDFLPRQVPENSKGQYFAVEAFFMEQPQREALYAGFADLLIRLNCYFDLVVTDGVCWKKNAPPQELQAKIRYCSEREYVNVLIVEENSLLTLYGGDLYMTLYHPSDELLDTIRPLTAGLGLFVRG